MPSKKTSKVPRKPDGSIDWGAYDKILMDKWKDHVTVRTRRENGNLIIQLIPKISKRKVGGAKRAPLWNKKGTGKK